MAKKICPIVSRGMEIQFCKREQCMAWMEEHAVRDERGQQVTLPAHCRLLDQPLRPW